jgi:hypothetical protein
MSEVRSEVKPEDVEVLRKLRETVELYEVLVKGNKELEDIFTTLIRCLTSVEKLLKMEYVNITLGHGGTRFAVVCDTMIPIYPEITGMNESQVIHYVMRRFIEEKWPRVLEVITLWLKKIVENIRDRLYMVEKRREEVTRP